MSTFAAFGFFALCVSYVLLTALLLTSWKGNRTAAFLILACLGSVFWAGALALQLGYERGSPITLALLDVLRASVWIVFLVRLVSPMGVSRLLTSLSLAACAIVSVSVIVAGFINPTVEGDLFLSNSVLIPGGLVLSVFGLVLVEQLYRNASAEPRLALKPLVLGVGGIFAYDLFLYSQGMLLNGIDATTWQARGVVNIVFVPMIAVAARRNPDWNVRIFVSRHVVFYSTTLFASGLYLLLMSLGGYLILRYGGSWGGLARTVFLFGAVVLLFTLLFLSTFRARLRVFLNKHFFRNRYDYREEWLRLVTTLGAFDSTVGADVAIRAMAQIIESPAGAIWTHEPDTGQFVLRAQYATNDKLMDFRADDEVISFVASTGWLIDFDELEREPELYSDLRLPEWLYTMQSARLLVPMFSSGELLGLILLYRAPAIGRLNYEDRDLLKTVGNHIAVHLAQARADSMLAESQQFEAYNRLTAFLMHDLNNLIAQQSLIVSNAEKHRRNPDFVDDAVSTIAGSVERMKRVMQMLKSGGAENPVRKTELKFIVSTAVDRCSSQSPVPELLLHDSGSCVNVNPEELIMVLTHLIRNAQDACERDSEVVVEVTAAAGVASVTIRDTGGGMSPDFVRNRLFRPFDSTKGAQGMGIGAYQARDYARRLGGELAVESTLGQGTLMTLTIPLHQEV